MEGSMDGQMEGREKGELAREGRVEGERGDPTIFRYKPHY